MSDLCAAEHPERSHVTCEKAAGRCFHQHNAYDPQDGPVGKPVSWPNPLQPPSSKKRGIPERPTQEVPPKTAGTPQQAWGEHVAGSKTEPCIQPGEPGVVGVDHPATSHEAARIVDAGSQLARTLLAIYQGGAQGRNAAELVPLVGITISVMGTRLGTLRKRGLADYLLNDDGGRVTRQGSSALTQSDVHIVTSKGVEELQHLRML